MIDEVGASIVASDVIVENASSYKAICVALDGGEDGLIFYRHIVKEWSKKLKEGGLMAFEADPCEMEDIRKLLLSENFTDIKIINDLGDLQRVIYGYKYKNEFLNKK